MKNRSRPVFAWPREGLGRIRMRVEPRPGRAAPAFKIESFANLAGKDTLHTARPLRVVVQWESSNGKEDVVGRRCSQNQRAAFEGKFTKRHRERVSRYGGCHAIQNESAGASEARNPWRSESGERSNTSASLELCPPGPDRIRSEALGSAARTSSVCRAACGSVTVEAARW